MAKKIVRRDQVELAKELSDLPPVLQRVFSFRDIQSKSQLTRELVDLIPFGSLKNIDVAVERLVAALERQERVMIVGDFDADGATSTCVAVLALRLFGLETVDYIVPNRFDYGYGLTPEIVDVAAKREPDLIITVDNGISSVAGVAHARHLGIDVLVTDHHLQGDEVPQDCIIVNPNQQGCEFPSKNLAGVGVIFYVMLALRASLKESNWFVDQQIPSPNMGQFLDLVALGTVADVVPLDHNNRLLVYHGLQRIRTGKARPSIYALLDIAGRKRERMRASDLGYAIGPRLNAAGRLDDMSLGIACLLEPNYRRAKDMGSQLDQLNVQRRALEVQMQDEAFAALDKLNLDQDNFPFGICVYEPDWHQGVVGLVAARVKERLHRPVIAFAKESDTMLKGSARSVSGLHIRDTLDALAKRYPHLMSKFGGHAMAAGLAIKIDDYDAFCKAFNEVVSERVTEERLEAKVFSDGALKGDQLTMKTAQVLRQAGPWGQGFPEPLFDGEFSIIEQRLVGERHLKMLLMAPDCDFCFDAIAFNVDTKIWPNEDCANVNLAYRLDVNEYRGREKLQLLVEEIHAIGS